ncbi:hypothetical protein Ocin01_17700 [Orchesella cincta]|uniref:Uncharacterized protein n=1 Tax=Orchesella cincta TaxID=48709 RepID=A0A1D2M7S5_ORCCI|nr:hypothetical protein Ocin01_17700 [Orchesella cincta]
MEVSIRNCLIASLVIVFLLQLVSSRSSQPRYYTSTDSDGVERVVELIPSSVTVRPRPRQRIRSDFAKQYWISGNFFNRENFKAIPTLRESNEGRSASASVPRPLIFKTNVMPVAFETIQEL